MAATIHNDTFETDVLQSDVPVLVDFWAPWCGPCRAIAPAVDELAAKYEGRARVVKVNIDDSSELAITYGISSIPAFLVFKDGEVQQRTVGAVPSDKLAEMIDQQIG